MYSQEPPKKKSKRDNGLFCLYNECTCVDVMYFVQYAQARTSWKNTRIIMALNGSDKSVSTRAHAQSLNTHHRKTYLNVPHGGDNENAVVYIGIATNYLSS